MWHAEGHALTRCQLPRPRRLLEEKAPSAVLTSMLLCLSQLARMSQEFYEPIRQAEALPHVRPPSTFWQQATCHCKLELF